MTAPLEMTDHITDNELAGIVEHGIRRADRRTVRHLAECGECNEALMMASEIEQQMQAEDGVERPEFGGGRAWWKVAASAAALAAGLFVVFGAPLREKWFGPKGTEALAEASEGVRERATAGRLSGFPYQDWSPKRGAEDDDDFAFLRIEPAAAKVLRDPEADPHATGVAYLVRKTEERARTSYATSVAYLEKALAKAEPEERAAVVNDLAVALLGAGSDADLARALQLLEEQWRNEQTPEIAFNRAVALEHQGRYKEAVAAWDAYLRLDPDSQWAAEAKRRKGYLLDLNP
jgi:tetratricopeptide (TPR) repeat protein